MTDEPRPGMDYRDRDVEEEILVRQRRDMWTPEQRASLIAHFRLRPGMAMLDAGCGHGYCMRTFGPACLPGGRLVGLDREPHLLEKAERFARDEGLGDVASFVRGDLYELPFERDTFDAVLMQVVMCHLAQPERALDEMIRVATPGGCIVVFDNAINGFDEGWSSTATTLIGPLVRRCEEWFLANRGRKALGRGDWSVGLRVPGWMEARGLDDVDVRINERAHWIAPPYRSPAQQQALEHVRARGEEDGFDRMHIRNTTHELRAAGADETFIRGAVRAIREGDRRFRQAVTRGDGAFSAGGNFWCIWGFKPRSAGIL